MSDNKIYMIIASTLSVSLYIFILVLIFKNDFKPKNEDFTSKKEKSIEISIISQAKKKTNSVPPIKKTQPIKAEKEKPKQPEITKEKIKRVKLENIFDDVKLKKIEKPKVTKVIKQAPKEEVPKKLEVIKIPEKDIKSISKELSDLLDGNKTISSKDTNNKKYTDKYSGYIKDIFKFHWTNTIATASGNEATISVNINEDAKMNYKVLEFSNSELFNQKLEKFLKDMQNVTFNKPNNKVSMQIILKDEEND
ncbi:MAG: Unknown protein [uncultured Campylobacterales bacterium]|uniref:Uncharacterized protein n=1 Tax=uncultured Campylobacterales bacterium TaxID=352960 RepID=A0A6S6S620_9BACT|nr:MAG: Unknown protein [uncultured Campylobacterales bacterium]